MAAALFVGRVGGLAVALGVGAAVFNGGVAWADSGSADSGSRGAGATNLTERAPRRRRAPDVEELPAWPPPPRAPIREANRFGDGLGGRRPEAGRRGGGSRRRGRRGRDRGRLGLRGHPAVGEHRRSGVRDHHVDRSRGFSDRRPGRRYRRRLRRQRIRWPAPAPRCSTPPLAWAALAVSRRHPLAAVSAHTPTAATTSQAATDGRITWSSETAFVDGIFPRHPHRDQRRRQHLDLHGGGLQLRRRLRC